MSKRQKSRYLFAVYLVVAFIAIILALVAFQRGNDTWQSLLLNLSTELLGVVFLFFLVNYFFLLDDWNLSEQVEELLKQLELRDHPIATQFFRPMPDITPYINQSIQIDLCGVTLSSTTRKHLIHLHERLWEGCNIRLLIIDPDSTVAIETASSRSSLGTVPTYQKALETTLQDAERLLQRWSNHKNDIESTMKGSVSLRLMPYLPPFGIQAFKTSKLDGTMFIEIYPHQTPTKSAIFELTSQRDGDWYEYFTVQFDKLWNDAKPWSPKEKNSD